MPETTGLVFDALAFVETEIISEFLIPDIVGAILEVFEIATIEVTVAFLIPDITGNMLIAFATAETEVTFKFIIPDTIGTTLDAFALVIIPIIEALPETTEIIPLATDVPTIADTLDVPDKVEIGIIALELVTTSVMFAFALREGIMPDEFAVETTDVTLTFMTVVPVMTGEGIIAEEFDKTSVMSAFAVIVGIMLVALDDPTTPVTEAVPLRTEIIALAFAFVETEVTPISTAPTSPVTTGIGMEAGEVDTTEVTEASVPPVA